MKKNNKGFSLVELIIVIAIMAVLIGVLAPQYMKHVKNSKISTDVTNAQNIATAVNAAIADGSIDSVTGLTSGSEIAGGAAITNLAGVTVMPTSKVKSDYKWVVTWNATDGVTSITLGTAGSTVEIYPSDSAYRTANP